MDITDLNSYTGGFIGLISSAGPVAKTVVFVLLFFSVVSWTIFLYKWRQLSSVESDGDKFIRLARDSDSFKSLPPSMPTIRTAPSTSSWLTPTRRSP